MPSSPSEEALSKRSDLGGKFIGEVERAEKSISVVNLSAVARALKVPLRTLTDVPRDWRVFSGWAQALMYQGTLMRTMRSLPFSRRNHFRISARLLCRG